MVKLDKLFLLLKKIFFEKSWHKSKYFLIFIILINIFLLFCVTIPNLKRPVYEEPERIKFSNVFDFDKIKKLQIDDDSGKEETIIKVKAMLLGIILFVNFFSFRQGLIGFCFGTFIGSCIGIWLSMLFPSFFYLWELIFRSILRIDF